MFKIVKCVIISDVKFVTNSCVNYKSGKYFSTNERKLTGNTNCIDNKTAYQNVTDYYAGKSVLITGGTGFLGKVLIERILYTCDDIENIYVLIREKKGLSLQKRLEQMVDVPLFDKIKAVKPSILSKLVPIAGDITKPNLAISSQDEDLLIEKVSVVFHSAATVRFIDTFRDTLSTNFEGTRKVMDLSKKIKNLDTFVYISTAFSNNNELVIKEKIYPPPKEIEEVRWFLQNHGDDQKEITKFIRSCKTISGYTLSKALSENLVAQEHSRVPIIVVRPSIVTPVHSSSLPGWLDSWVAATALFSDVARGLTRVIHGKSDVVCDLIPVDFVCNLATVAAARGNRSNKPKVYNSCSSSTNPITWKQGADLFLQESLKDKNYKSELKPGKVMTSPSSTVVSVLTFITQTTPAYLADVVLRMKGEKPRHMKMQKRAILLRDLIKSFTSTSWLIESKNTLELIDTMSQKDKNLFPCDPRSIVWKDYIMGVFYKGVQNYMFDNKK